MPLWVRSSEGLTVISQPPNQVPYRVMKKSTNL
jgi:hypothetical protein